MGTSGLTGTRVAVAAAFFAQGFVFISLTTRLPQFLDTWGLDEVALSLLLLMMVLLAGVGSLVAERAARSVGSAVLLRTGLALMVIAIPALTLAPVVGVFVGGVALYGVALGLVDATTNMQGVDLEHRYDRLILPSSHGYWTTGGISATVVVLTTGHLSPTIGAFTLLVPLVIAFAPFLPRAEPKAPTPPDTTPIPWRPLWLVGAALVVFYMVDTTAAAWGPVYLARSFDAPGNLVALATFPYLVTSIVVRLSGGYLVPRFGVVFLLRVGAVLACGALTLVVLAPSWPVAVVGFALLGAAVALVAPLSFSAAGRIAARAGTGRTGTDAVIARFNQFNYVGALLGAVLTGLVGSGDLRLGFALPAVLVLALVPLAPAFARGTLKRVSERPSADQ